MLETPNAISAIVQMLDNERETLRNEAILLLIAMTRTSQELQKIVVFENVFDKLLRIIEIQHFGEGGVVVEDCLILLQTLVKDNPSNQNFFREYEVSLFPKSQCVPRLAPLLQLHTGDLWALTDQKAQILATALRLVSELIPANGPNTESNQTSMAAAKILLLVVNLALGPISSQMVRSQALLTLGHLLHAHANNLATFAAMTIAREAGPQPALLRLLMISLYARDLPERVAAFQTYKSYLAGNEEAQVAIGSTFTPSPTGEGGEPQSIGGQILKALFSWETDPHPDLHRYTKH